MRTLEERFCVVEDVVKNIYKDCKEATTEWEETSGNSSINPYAVVYDVKEKLQAILEGKK